MKKLQELSKDIKAWMAAGAVIVAASGAVYTYAKLPEKVDKLKKEIKENGDNVQKLSHTVDKFIAVTAEQKKQQDKREELILKLIEKMTQKKGGD